MAAPLEKKYVKNKISLLSAGIQVAEDEGAKRREILSHIKFVEHDGQFQLDDLEFPGGLAWFNSDPLSLARDLRGKLVVLDFFTYCCINCMHVLPDLASLEQAHSVEDGLIVVGVHSAKFLNEKVSENIENAVRRYEISHPVVNDSDIVLWNQLGVVCWPTLVILGPSGRLLHYIIGEGHGAELALFVDTALEYYRGEGGLAGGSIPALAGGGGRGEEGGEGGGSVTEATPLRYPGKVVCGREEGEGKLYVSDTGHHKVVVVDRGTGAVTAEYGSGEPGLIDGETQEARFRSPQGLVRDGDNLYVADTENHVIRKVDMGSGSVSTVTGTGVQGNDKEGGGKERLQGINSPWDLALGDSGTGGGRAVLYIAMAGTHQIWAHFLTDCTWIRGSQQERGVTVRFTGSGEEANRNNSYPHKACFAQPSGVTLTKEGGLMYVADSESSTVRCVSLRDGSVKAVVGGAIDPLDLFAYGDVDGKGREARLQHPLGVVWSETEKLLYVADSYNHKIKVVDPTTKRCTTLAGTGQSGLVDGPFEHAQFSEPGGLCLDPTERELFVADTNNHVIRVLDLDQRTVTQLRVKAPDVSVTRSAPAPGFKRLTGKRAQVVQYPPVTVGGGGGGEVRLTLHVTLPPSTDWTSGATSAWQVIPEPGVLESCHPWSGVIQPHQDISLTLVTAEGLEPTSSTVQIELLVYFCEASGVCHMQGALLAIPLVPSPSPPSTPSQVTLHYSPQLPKTG